MKAASYLVDFLIEKGVTDVFGIPGGVVLDILYAFDERAGRVSAHLSYHEQAAAFAACGYAQASGKLGVAYATRGPGIANMLTAVADAFCDSIPILILTGHSAARRHPSMRVEQDQDMDPIPMFTGVTKYAARVERAEDVPCELEKAYGLAMEGRKGPVVLDFASRILTEEVDFPAGEKPDGGKGNGQQDWAAEEIVCGIADALKRASRPVFLIGNGINQSGTAAQMRRLAEEASIPVLSSLIAQDVMPDSPMYFGYIGSHGTRYGNFVLSKADLIIALGNRMDFPVSSKSFAPVVSRAEVIRVDVDEAEFLRELPNSRVFTAELGALLPRLLEAGLRFSDGGAWLAVCRRLKEALGEYDLGGPVRTAARLLQTFGPEPVIVSDVGNNPFWLARAYAYAGLTNPLLYSKSFSALGCALGKAVGAYYSTGKPVVCSVGDQGFQMNIQELQFIAQHKLPVTILLWNNVSSGMIRHWQEARYQGRYLHTTLDTGYSVPDFAAVARAYGLDYRCVTAADASGLEACKNAVRPRLIELRMGEDAEMNPNLPMGAPCQDLAPRIPRRLYEELDRL